MRMTLIPNYRHVIHNVCHISITSECKQNMGYIIISKHTNSPLILSHDLKQIARKAFSLEQNSRLQGNWYFSIKKPQKQQ